MVGKNQKVIVTLSIILAISLSALACAPMTVSAAPPTDETFTATIVYVTSGVPKHYWVDEEGVHHWRGAPCTNIILDCDVTEMELVDATVEFIENADLVGVESAVTTNGKFSNYGTITKVGEDRPSYRIQVFATVTDGTISGSFTITGKGELVTGEVNGFVGEPCVLTGPRFVAR